MVMSSAGAVLPGSLPSALPAELYDGGLPLQEFMGLPLHPLLVHGAVVLLPLAGLGAILIATDIKRSKSLGGIVVLLAGVAALFGFLAMASGRDLAAAIGYGGERQHFVLGGWLPWFGLALFVVTLLLWLMDKKPPKRNLFSKILSIAAIAIAIGTIGWTVYVGHLGAELTWSTRI